MGHVNKSTYSGVRLYSKSKGFDFSGMVKLSKTTSIEDISDKQYYITSDGSVLAGSDYRQYLHEKQIKDVKELCQRANKQSGSIFSMGFEFTL